MISKEEIQNLAELARLKISDEEVAALQKDISNILEYVETVSSVEMPHGQTVRHGQETPLHTILRDDTLRAAGNPLVNKQDILVAAFPTRESLARGTGTAEGNYNVVRKIIQKDE